MRIAHISDLHVKAPGHVPLHRYLNKRFTGAVNLLTLRKDAHSTVVLDALIDDIVTQDVDHTCITGDLTNLSLEEEFERAKETLLKLGDGSLVSIVPGNHDIYTRGAERNKRFESYFGEWMGEATSFPFRKELGNGVSITGLKSAIPTPLLTSYGRIGAEQLQELQSATGESSDSPASTFELVLLHHNLHPRSSGLKDWSSGLKDRTELLGTLLELETDLVLHGHTHVAHRTAISRDDHTLHIIGCGSSTWTHPEHMARYNIYHIENQELQRVETRVYIPESQTFQTQANEIQPEENPGWSKLL